MMQKKNIFKVIAFGALGVVIFLMVQNVLVPREKMQFQEMFYTKEMLEDNTVEVLLLGTSHMQAGISPMQMYEDAQITAFNMATSVQQLDESYYLLKDTFEKQSPKVVVLDASSLFNALDVAPEYRRYVLESLPMGNLKIELAKQFEQYGGEGGALSVLVPLVKYHAAWDEVNAASFAGAEESLSYTAGYAISREVAGSDVTQEEIDLEAELIVSSQGYSKIATNGMVLDEVDEEELGIYEVGEEQIEYLLQIQALCEENGAELLLTKIPTRISTVDYTGAWTESKSEEVREVAQQCGIDYFDMVYDTELGLDYSTDTGDGGKHLNLNGAEKATACLLDYLQKNYVLESRQNTYYEESLEKYKTVTEVAHLQLETNLNAYVDRLLGFDDITVIVTSVGEWNTSMESSEFEALQKLKLQLAQEAQVGDAYLAVIDNGMVLYEEISNRRVAYGYEDEAGRLIVACCTGAYYHGIGSSVQVDEQEYGVNRNGINIVVMDNESGDILDSVNFDTTTQEREVFHYNKVTSLPDVDE